MQRSLVISFSAPVRDPRPHDALLLEQRKWGYTGRVTRAAIVAWLQSLMFGVQPPVLDCGLDASGSCLTGVRVYPYDPGLVYTLALSHGELGDRVVREFEATEVVNVGLDTDASLKHPAMEILDAVFSGTGYDETGAATSPPAITVAGTTITMDRPVYGQLKVRYLVLAHEYQVRLPRREDAMEHRWSSVAYARWDGGVKWLELEPAPGAEEFADADADCGWGLGGSAFWPDDADAPPADTHANRVIRRDYCTQEIISDTTYAY